MSQSTEILAKRSPDKNGQAHYQTINGHARDCLTLLRHHLAKRKPILESACQFAGVSYEQFSKSLFTAIYLHDIGKATKQFQDNIMKNRHSQAYPHAFFAVPILFKFLKGNKRFASQGIQQVPIELLSILAHHTQLYNNMYRGVRTEPLYLHNQIKDFIRDISKVHLDLGFGRFFQITDELVIPDIKEREWIYEKDTTPLYQQILRFIQKVKDQLNNSDSASLRKTKFLYSLNNSILKTCDAFASRKFDEYIAHAQTPTSLYTCGGVLSQGDYNELFPEIPLVTPRPDWREFQKELIESDEKYVILRAPCGRGKTHPALVWAKHIAERYHRDKIIFAMPTQVTSNAMRNTVASYCTNGENVGLFHGRSFVYLKNSKELENETLSEADLQELRIGTYESAIFHKPIVVTTLDHVIYSAIHGYSKADHSLGNLLNSVIVFDEAHYYDFKAMSSFLGLLRLLRRFEVPHIVMSGTLPSFFSDRLNEGKEYSMIEDRPGFQLTPFIIKKSQEKLISDGTANSTIIEKIIQKHLSGTNGVRLRQTIILNTVSRAQTFFLALKERLQSDGRSSSEPGDLALYHSQFTYTDRARIEREILSKKAERPYILVGTQVIEVSLDISCDTMYSELAPIDCIGQRAGRLNRGGIMPETNGMKHFLYLFEPESRAPYQTEDDKDENSSLIRRSANLLKNGTCSYGDIKKMTDALYRHKLIFDPIFEESFLKGILFGPPYWSIADPDESGKPGFKFREEEVPTIFVVPQLVYDERVGKISLEDEVRVPYYKLTKREDSFKEVLVGSRRYIICSYPEYDHKIGFNDSQEASSNRMGSNII